MTPKTLVEAVAAAFEDVNMLLEVYGAGLPPDDYRALVDAMQLPGASTFILFDLFLPAIAVYVKVAGAPDMAFHAPIILVNGDFVTQPTELHA